MASLSCNIPQGRASTGAETWGWLGASYDSESYAGFVIGGAAACCESVRGKPHGLELVFHTHALV
jgi:hypothetical protein